MVLPLKVCDIVLGVQWLLALGDTVWNFSSLTMQFIVKGQPCIIGIVPGSLVSENDGSNSRCFVTAGQALGPYKVVIEFT